MPWEGKAVKVDDFQKTLRGKPATMSKGKTLMDLINARHGPVDKSCDDAVRSVCHTRFDLFEFL